VLPRVDRISDICDVGRYSKQFGTELGQLLQQSVVDDGSV